MVEMEIDATMKRQEIDDQLFRLSFMAPVSKRVEKIFQELKSGHEDYYLDHSMKQTRKATEEGKEIQYYDAKIIFEFLIKEYNKIDKTFTRPKMLLILFASMLYGISPGIFRVIYGETFHGETLLIKLAFYLNGLSSAFLMLTALMSFTSAKMDMRRRSSSGVSTNHEVSQSTRVNSSYSRRGSPVACSATGTQLRRRQPLTPRLSRISTLRITNRLGTRGASRSPADRSSGGQPSGAAPGLASSRRS